MHEFANMIAVKELESYVEAQAQMRILAASDFWPRVRAALYGEKQHVLTLPWGYAHGKFDIRQGELTIWTGYKGHGKTSVLSHAMIGLMVQGEKVLVISPEFTAEGLLVRKIRQLAGTTEPEEGFAKKAMRFLGEHLWLLDHQGLVPWRLVMGACRYAYDRFGISQVVIDSLMKCGIAPDDHDIQKQFVDRLQSFAHDTGAHVHLVAHARKGMDDSRPAGLHDIKGTSEIGDMAENVVSVWMNKKKAKAEDKSAFECEPDCRVTIEAQRNHSWMGSIPLDFHPSAQFLPTSARRPFEYL
jgi:twinkle protein